MTLRVIGPGLQSSIQDLGRRGFQRFGLSVSGAADKYALRFGNLLLGNPLNAAAIETTLFGLELEALDDCAVAVTGGDLGLQIDHNPASTWRVLQLQMGQRLRFGGGPKGCRAYVCVQGGIDVPMQYGSRSTDALVGLGGIDGRVLHAGDVISTNFHLTTRWHSGPPLERRLVNPRFVPQYVKEQTLHVILGPQETAFTPEAIATLLASQYRVSPDSNRIGCHLEGPLLQHKSGADILSECIPEGAVQVPSAGKPLILLAGRRGIGGYTKIATVAGIDIPKVAQSRPGDWLSFEAVSVEQAQSWWLEQEHFFQSAEAIMATK
ncbi:biotin-dependent carboxyltransferase [Alicyclobacillaceae bacterium I2511]|nr:biotin-dependent carboxyltransferase [Alicyclobacillaceae bacterium I2511]